MTTEQQVHAVRAAGENGAIHPFRVDIPDESLEALRQRIAATRLPSKELVEDRSQGVQLTRVGSLWRCKFAGVEVPDLGGSLGGGHLLGGGVGRGVAAAVELLAVELGEPDAVGLMSDQ